MAVPLTSMSNLSPLAVSMYLAAGLRGTEGAREREREREKERERERGGGIDREEEEEEEEEGGHKVVEYLT